MASARGYSNCGCLPAASATAMVDHACEFASECVFAATAVAVAIVMAAVPVIVSLVVVRR